MDISFDASDGAKVEAFEAFGVACRGDDPYQLFNQAPAGSNSQRYFAVAGPRGDLRAQLVADSKSGYLGYYDAAKDVTRAEIERLMSNACRFLQSTGHRIAVGPINGSTWGSYRLTVPDGRRPFFLDNHHPAAYTQHWRAAGFVPVERYLSTVTPCIRMPPAPCSRFERRLAQRGITVQSVTSAAFAAELRAIHELSNEAFRRAPHFSPIGYEEFETLYREVITLVDRNWVLMAHGATGELLAFIFATPDRFDPQAASLVIKTVASVEPGLGSWLTGIVHQRAVDAGYEHVIHALMHERNRSTNIHAADAEVLRRYQLLGLRL